MIEKKFGLRIKTSPDKITVAAVTNEGALALSTWVKLLNDTKQLRAKLNISEKEYPITQVKQTLNGIIYMVTFLAE